MSGLLLTGATTPLGRALVRKALERGEHDRILAVGAEPPEMVDLEVEDARLSYRRVDLTRSRSVHDLLFGVVRDLDIDSIIHAPLHRSAVDTGPRVHAINVASTRQLLLQAERHPGIRRLVLRSHAEIYEVQADQPSLVSEDHPINFSPTAPQWLRDRIEADLMVCSRMGLSDIEIAVLRCSEVLAADMGSQLWDYLQSRVCFRPLGYDPMLNLLTIDDLVDAALLATRSHAQGVFNIPGSDTLPLSEVVRKWGRIGIPVPGLSLTPLYRLRAAMIGTEFRYDLNHWRFHFNGVLDGRRARSVLGYAPHHRISWPTAS